MLNRISIGNYLYKNSIIHKIHPLSKIISLLMIIIMILIGNTYANVILLILSVIYMFISKINIKIFFKNILSIKWFLFFIVIINLIFKTKFFIVVLSILKLSNIILYTSLFMYTTSITEIMIGLEMIFYPLNKLKFNTNKIIVILTFSLKFIPLILEQASIIIKSLASRGLDFRGNFKNKCLCLKAILIPLFLNSIKKADNISDIIQIRCYNLNNIINSNNNFKIIDILNILINLGLIIIIMRGMI